MSVIVRQLGTFPVREIEYTCSARDAVIAAYAQAQGDWNTWDYAARYRALVTETDHTITCGDFCVVKRWPVRFGLLAEGAVFDTGLSEGVGAQQGVARWVQYRKETRSRARCIAQAGWGNQRAVGVLQAFSHNTMVFQSIAEVPDGASAHEQG